MSKEYPKHCFLKSGQTKSFTVSNFRNKVAKTIIFFSKCLKFDVDSGNANKNFLVVKIIPIESGTTNWHNPEQDICHWQWMCYEISLRFNISLREIFPKSVCPIVMKKYDESVLIQISQEVWTPSHLNCQRSFRNSVF